MIETVLFQLLRATVFLAVGFPVVWLLIHFGRLRSALGQRIAWGSLLAVSLLCMTVTLRIPVAVESVESATKIVEPVSEEMITIPLPDYFESEPVVVAEIPVVTDVIADDHDPAVTEPAEIEILEKPDPATILAGIWLLGLAILFGRRLFAHVSLLKLLRRAPPVVDPQWSALLREHGISKRKIPLRLTESTGPALVRGPLFRLSLIVPKSLWDEISPVLRQGILRHELGHYRHGDALLSPLLFFLAALQWFNPFAWLVLRCYDEATEWHADQFAYGSRETGSSELAETFLAIHRSTESLGLYLNSFSRFSTLDRVNRLLPVGGKERLVKKLVLGIVLLLLLSSGLFRIQLVAREDAESTPSAAEIAAPAESARDTSPTIPLGEEKEFDIRLDSVSGNRKAETSQHWITVMDDETGEPLAEVAATLKYPVQGVEKPKSITTKSDKQGRIFLPRAADMAPDDPDKPKFCVLELEFEKYVSAQRVVSPKSVDEKLKEQKPVFDDVRMQRATRITGRIVSENDGSPVPDARILAVGERQLDNPPRGFVSSKTLQGDEDGRFSVLVGKREAANLQIRAKNFALKRFYVKEGDDHRDEIELGDIFMSAGFRPTVQVLDKDGKPVPDVWVNLSLVRTSLEEEEMERNKSEAKRNFGLGTGGITALTDPEGIARFEPIEAGSYFIGVREYPGWPYRNDILTTQHSPEFFKPIKGVFENQAVLFTTKSAAATIRAVKPRRVEVRFSDKTTGTDRENQIWIEGDTSNSYHYKGKYQGDGVFVFEVPDQLRGAKLFLGQSATRGFRIDNEISYRCFVDGKEVFPPGYTLEFPLYPLYSDKTVELTCFKSPKVVLRVVDEDGEPVGKFFAGAQYVRRGQTITFTQDENNLVARGYGYMGATTSSRNWEYASTELGGAAQLDMDVDFMRQDSGTKNEWINGDGILPDEELRLYVIAKGYQVAEQKIPKLAEGEVRELTVTIEKIPED